MQLLLLSSMNVIFRCKIGRNFGKPSSEKTFLLPDEVIAPYLSNHGLTKLPTVVSAEHLF